MVKMDSKALNFVKGKNLCFVAGVKKTQIDCECGGCNTSVRTLRVRVLFETEVLDKELYDIYKYQGAKVFVLKDLKITGDINVYQKSKIPFMEPKFGIRGITT